MGQESYADFSIIQKYLDQKRYYDEAMKGQQSKVAALESTISALQDELSAKDEALKQLREQTDEYQARIKDKEKMVQDLNLAVHRLKKQVGETQPNNGAPGAEEQDAKRAKFGFLKK